MLSIIIPVYNSEKYLSECLTSVFYQDLPVEEYEVIVINDGSVDESKNIILDFKEKHKNLIFIDQKNNGVSAARNAGLAIAKGEYITFIDSDDFVLQNTLVPILNHIQKNKLDILYCPIQIIKENGTFLSFLPPTGIENVVLEGFSHPRRTFPAVFYRREPIKDLRFHTGISIGEDTLFNAVAQAKCERVSYFSKPYYCHRSTPNSLSSLGDFERKANEMYLAIIELLSFKNKEFQSANTSIIEYFDGVFKIFLTRIIQWNLLQKGSKNNFLKFQRFVSEQKMEVLLKDLVVEFPYLDQSYSKFVFYQKAIKLKAFIRQKISFRILT